MGSSWDAVVIGGGIAGASAAVELAEQAKQVVLVDQMGIGGRLIDIPEISSVLGVGGSRNGPELAGHLTDWITEAGVEILLGTVVSLFPGGDVHRVATTGSILETRTVVLATGTSSQPPGVDGLEALRGRGVSECVACDALLFRDEPVVVAGSDDWTAAAALYLSDIASQVYLVGGKSFRCSARRREALASKSTVTLLLDAEIIEVVGDAHLTGVRVRDDGSQRDLAARGLFCYGAVIPEVKAVDGVVAIDAGGFVVTDGSMATNVPGVYAVGDVRSDSRRTLVAAAADGATAGRAASRFLDTGR